MLRILGGGTYMDMVMVFETSFNHAHKIFKQVVVEWLCHKAFYPSMVLSIVAARKK